MAQLLASIHGTEQDKINCPFYYKMGACRHGDLCSRSHQAPPFGQVIMMPNFYQNPKRVDLLNPESVMALEEQQRYFEEVCSCNT